jgi:hypothetical protein
MIRTFRPRGALQTARDVTEPGHAFLADYRPSYREKPAF